MKGTIAVLAGDGIGPEVMPQALRVLKAVSEKFGHTFTIKEAAIGGDAFDRYQSHFPDETKKICEESDAILFGSVGGPVTEAHLPKWNGCEKNSILSLRKTFQLSANLRPVNVYKELFSICPLKDSRLKEGVDILIIRELLGDIYFGEHKQWVSSGKNYASDVAEYNEMQIAAVSHRGFQLAQKRGRKKLTSVDKANVLDTSKLWRTVMAEVALQYPDVQFENMLVDNCAMQLVINPTQFDVIVTANLFGDILSDLAAALPGSLGLMPSASLNDSRFGLYEPSGGSAPDIAGKNIANPIAQILSLALMLRYTFDLYEEADSIDNAVKKALHEGFRTRDIYEEGMKLASTEEMTNAILKYL